MKRRIVQNCRVENKVYFCTSIYYHPRTYSYIIYHDIKFNHDIVTLDGRSPVIGNTLELSKGLWKVFNRYNILERCGLFV